MVFLALKMKQFFCGFKASSLNAATGEPWGHDDDDDDDDDDEDVDEDDDDDDDDDDDIEAT